MTDIPAIVVLGETGVGKSFFINKATRNDDVRIGHGLNSETEQIRAFTTEIDGLKISLVDTIGFDDTYRSDTDVLGEVASWLAGTYLHGIRLAGVLYMRNIASPRFSGSALKNLRMFTKLVGEEQLGTVTLVTTQWQYVDTETGLQRMRQLGETNSMWGAMLARGSTIESFDGTTEGAHNILRKVLSRKRSTVLNIQRELVDQELDLSETAAGKLIREEIEKLQAKHTREMTEIRSYMKEALDLKDNELSRMLTEEKMRLDQKLAAYQTEITDLKARNSTLEELRNAHHDQMRRLEDSFGDRLQFLEEQNVLPPPSYDEVQSHHGAEGQLSRQNTSLELSSRYRSLVSAFIEIVRKLLRPKVPPGYKRLEWTCTCGEPLYGDFKEATPGSLAQLAARLKQHTSRGSQQGTTVPIQTPKKAHAKQAQPVGWNMPSGSSSSIPSDPNNLVGNVADPRSVTPSRKTALQLCIETSQYSLELGELDSSIPISDGALFARMRAQYERTRHSVLPMWARFKKPDKAVFVKFRLGKRPFVSLICGTLEAPSLPPASEVSHNYNYDPCPIDEPPIDSRTFFHHFYAHASQHLDTIWSERLPWKVGSALESKAHGWGIHLEERPDWPLLAALMCVLLLLSGAVAGIYGWMMGDAQTGVAIGAWLTSVQVMGITAVFFWWS